MIFRTSLIILFILMMAPHLSQGQTGGYTSYEKNSHGVVFQSQKGDQLRFQFYTNQIVRITWARPGKTFLADDRYEMVQDHHRKGTFTLEEQEDQFILQAGEDTGVTVTVNKSPLRFSFRHPGDDRHLLEEAGSMVSRGDTLATRFQWDPTEHFCGLGHQTYGYVKSLDLQGRIASSNYGEGKHTHWGPQGVLTVPFYMSDKGYGIFLNSTHHHLFHFGKDGRYGFQIETKGFRGQMDYFFIYGPEFKQLLDRYTQLTGRPRLPQRSIFGLHLSDKGSPDHPGAEWWKEQITEHREAGFPFDHIVNDNRWRAGSGAWSGSWFEWDSTRFPNPEKFNRWTNDHHVTVTLDLNRNIIADCKGWKPEYNLPQAEKYVAHGNSAPDYSDPQVRNWIWELFWEQSFNPELNYPGDGLWIDETDDLHTMNDSIILANGRSWAENENYYPFLIAKAVVQEGWDNENDNRPPGIGPSKRPFVWMRSMMAGAQRYATHWTGDIYPTCQWMKNTIRGMQASGLSGFPYFNHDAGGFMDPGPDDSMYIQWSMAMGSLTPIWRPHGMGKNKRWPLDRSEKGRQAAMKYGKMRYQMMPYIYTYAHKAHSQGTPMARAMVLSYQNHPEAWEHDLQYMWGEEMLVAPVCSQGDTVRNVWLPPGQDWYVYWNDNILKGGQTIRYQAGVMEIPLFVREGSIIPRYPYAQSTFTMDESRLILDVYTGRDASFKLVEDDGVTEKYRTRDEKRSTPIEYHEDANRVTIHPARGSYQDAPTHRSYRIRIHGMENPNRVDAGTATIKKVSSEKEIPWQEKGYFWNEKQSILTIQTLQHPVEETVEVSF
jgi:alpha-D-xyloside xylohydrolase